MARYTYVRCNMIHVFNVFYRVLLNNSNNKLHCEKLVTERINKVSLAIVCVALMGLHSKVFAQTSLTLHDTLMAAIERQSTISSQRGVNQISTDTSLTAWIDGAPSISLMRLESQENLGTTESEISLNVPFKSPFLRQVEETLLSKVESVRKSSEQQYALYISGLIRNVLWDIELEKVSLEGLARKQDMLGDLSEQFKHMANVQAIPQYLFLIVQNELNQQKIQFLQHQQNIKSLTDKYSRLTGLYALPDDITETASKSEIADMNLHPDVQAVDTLFESTQQQLLGASKRATSWSVQLTGRRVNTPSFSENQLGIGIEVPIVMGDNLSTVQQSELSRINTEYIITKQKLLLELMEAQTKLRQERDFLEQKQILFNDGLPTLNSLVEAMDELRAANAPDQEFFIRTLLTAFDSQQDAELNLLYIERHVALINQASGITL